MLYLTAPKIGFWTRVMSHCYGPSAARVCSSVPVLFQLIFTKPLMSWTSCAGVMEIKAVIWGINVLPLVSNQPLDVGKKELNIPWSIYHKTRFNAYLLLQLCRQARDSYPTEYCKSMNSVMAEIVVKITKQNKKPKLECDHCPRTELFTPVLLLQQDMQRICQHFICLK